MHQLDQLDDTRVDIWEMFRQPTGTHFLDSGGDAGRAWQQLAGIDAGAFWAAPPVLVTSTGYGDTVNAPGVAPELTISTAHVLAECVTLDRGAAAGLGTLAAAYPAASWFEIAERWREMLPADSEVLDGFNTYNFETLAGTILQGYSYRLPGDDVSRLIVQSHNGADARGGYSAPHAYAYRTSGALEYRELGLLVGLTDCLLGCDRCTFSASVRACWELDVYETAELPESAGGVHDFGSFPHWRGTRCPSCDAGHIVGELTDPASY